jgi:transcription antitermination factor NusG
MEGYAFVASGLPETQYFGLERESPYVKNILSEMGPEGVPVLSVLPDRAVQEMKDKLREIISGDIDVGMKVRVTQGTFGKLEGDVIDVEGDDAQVFIKLRSYRVIATIPRVFLEPWDDVEDNDE